jgi:hypothetical protein
MRPGDADPPAYRGPEVTVTRPDDDGAPVELLEAGPDEPRELPRWAKRGIAAAVAGAVAVSVGSDLLDRWQEHRLEARQKDALQVRPGSLTGGDFQGEVSVVVGLRNDGPRAVRLRDPRVSAPGLEGVVGVTADETVPAGEEGSLSLRVEAACPPADLTGIRVVVSVTVVADSGRERQVELDVTSLPGLLERACRTPGPADDLRVEVDDAVRDGDALRVRLSLDVGDGGAGELVDVGTGLFDRVEVRGALPRVLPETGGVGVELLLGALRCDRGPYTGDPDPATDRATLELPLDVTVRALRDRSVAGTGTGTRRGSADPARRVAEPGGIVVGQELLSLPGAGVEQLRAALDDLARDTC